MKAYPAIAGLVFSCCRSFSGDIPVPDVWQTRASPSTNQLNGVGYGNGLFVIVGARATILTSWNGIDWVSRSAGTTLPTLYSVIHGDGRYVIGGEEGALIRTSTDGIHWTNGLSTIGHEHVHGLTHGFGLFIGVGAGSGPELNSSYLITSTDGLDWIPQFIPTTNRLLAVAAASGPNGAGWPDPFFVAVGERGTVLTSTNGVNWTTRNSGTTRDLRTVIFQDGFLVGGDNGTVLSSSNGLEWQEVARASFDVHGLASPDNGPVLAVGSFGTAGRLHVSVDGLTWPGSSANFPRAFKAAAYSAGSFVAVGDGGMIVQSDNSITGPTNEWTKTTSGYWEEPYWSLGRPPGMDQSLVAFRNPGWKALAIGRTTTTAHADSLRIQNLVVDAPAGSINQLLLNYAGVSVPLSIHSTFILGTNASIASHYSALHGGRLQLSGPASFLDSSQIHFDEIEVAATGPSQLALTNSSLATSVLFLRGGGTLHQSSGTSRYSTLRMDSASAYVLDNGTLQADVIALNTAGAQGVGRFSMIAGSIDVAGALELGRRLFNAPDARGELHMEGGWARFEEVNFLNGLFTQTGGTNITSTIALPQSDYARGEYDLDGGLLVSTRVVLGAVLSPSTPPGFATFVQSGGTHSNLLLQLRGEIRRQSVTHYGNYFLSGGLLVSDAIQSSGGAFTQGGGTNQVRDLSLGDASSYVLNDGQLFTLDTTVDTCCCVQSRFVQNGGRHVVERRLLIEDFADYQLRAGTLVAPDIEIGPGAELLVQSGVISNNGVFTLRSGALRAGGQTQQLGKLRVIGEPVLVCVSLQPTGPTLDVGPGPNNGASVLHFEDSHDVSWSGSPVYIVHWSPTTNGFGPDHVYVGTNSQGLTSGQLSQVFFFDPIGWVPGHYPARMLATGEIIPAVPPLLNVTRNNNDLILTWPGEYKLITGTNVTGPYIPLPNAMSPVTIAFTEPQRFFRLATPEQNGP